MAARTTPRASRGYGMRFLAGPCRGAFQRTYIYIQIDTFANANIIDGKIERCM